MPGKFEPTNMVMIHDTAANRVVVLDRVLGWPVVTFPGGHIDYGESILGFGDTRSARGNRAGGVRAQALRYSALVEYQDTEDRVYWTDLDSLDTLNLSENFKHYLPLFLSDRYSEAFGAWTENEPYEMVYK
ncbi:MAG TPA: hypothetical protein PLZ84_03285 [Clostridia bacterium]|nr:hypothetical protein [Clostridia bacterium]